MQKDRDRHLFRGSIGRDEFSGVNVACCEDALCCVLVVTKYGDFKSVSVTTVPHVTIPCIGDAQVRILHLLDLLTADML